MTINSSSLYPISSLMQWPPNGEITGPFSWGGNVGAAVTVAYTFDSSNAEFPKTGDLTSTEQAAATAAMGAWENVANVSFTSLLYSSHDNHLVFEQAALPNYDAGVAIGDFQTGDIVSGSNLDEAEVRLSNTVTADYSVGGFGYQVLIHEIGHTLGLSHPDDDDTLTNFNRSETLMSIVYSNEVPSSSTSVLTPMVYDIAAAQYLYGANTSYHSGADTYSFDGSQTSAQTIWDGGGTDTFDISGAPSTGADTIDLRGGLKPDNTPYFSHVGSEYVAIALDPAIADGHTGIVIEKAIGSGGNDTIFGNYAANTLSGGAGNDHLSGGAGSDSLDGGAGNDTLYGYWNTLLDHPLSNPSSASKPTDDHDTLYGGDGSGSATLVGSVGTDSLIGGLGKSNLLIAQANDFHVDTLIGGNLNDTLWGNYGDSLDGGAGNDTVYGNAQYGGQAATILVNNQGDGADKFVAFSGGMTPSNNYIISGQNWGAAGCAVNAYGDGDSFVVNQGAALTVTVVTASAAADKLYFGTGQITGKTWLTLGEGVPDAWYVSGLEQGGTDYSFWCNPDEKILQMFHDNTSYTSTSQTDYYVQINNFHSGDFGIYITTAHDTSYNTLTDSSPTALASPSFLTQFPDDSGAASSAVHSGSSSASISGTAGADSFHIDVASSAITTTITNFQASNTSDSPDVIDLSDLGSSQAITVTQSGSNTDFTDGNNSVVLQGISAASLSLANFIGVSTLTNASAVGQNIVGTAGNDTLVGGAGPDTLSGGAGNNTLTGGAGADSFVIGVNPGSPAIDVVTDFSVAGGEHIDLTAFGTGLTVLATQAGADTEFVIGGTHVVDLQGVTATSLTASNFIGVSTFTVVNNAGGGFQFLAGNDTIHALTGSAYNDTIIGGTSYDTLHGGDGNDLIIGDPYNSTLNSADTLYGDGGNDTLIGAGGNDLLHGGAGNNVFYGGAYTDTFAIDQDTTGPVVDQIMDFRQNSTVNGAGEVIDVSAFGTGQTILAYQNGTETDFFVGGTHEVVVANATATNFTTANFVGVTTYTVVDDTSTITGHFIVGNDTIHSLTGTAFNDTIIGGNSYDTLTGGAGNDLIIGDRADATTNANDTLYGGDGNDTLIGGGGNDVLHGGAGSNVFYGGGYTDTFVIEQDTTGPAIDTVMDFRQNSTVYGAGETVDVSAFGSGQTVEVAQVGANTEFVVGGNHIVVLNNVTATNVTAANFVGVSTVAVAGDSAHANDTFLIGADNNVSITAGAGNDTIIGGHGYDTIYGGGGNDLIFAQRPDYTGTAGDIIHGGDGNDTLYGAGGNDTLYGEAGSNTFTGSFYTDTYVIGTDTSGTAVTDHVIDFRAASSEIVNLSAFGSSQAITVGQVGTDTYITLAGTTRTVVLDNVTASTLTTSYFTGVSTVTVASTTATSGNDALTGSVTAATSLNGGAGNDTLFGSHGADTLTGGAGNDLFVFTAGHSTATAKSTITDFTQGSDHIDVSGILGIHALSDLTITHAGSTTEIAHGSGADFDVILTGNLTLTAADFHFG